MTQTLYSFNTLFIMVLSMITAQSKLMKARLNKCTGVYSLTIPKGYAKFAQQNAFYEFSVDEQTGIITYKPVGVANDR